MLGPISTARWSSLQLHDGICGIARRKESTRCERDRPNLPDISIPPACGERVARTTGSSRVRGFGEADCPSPGVRFAKTFTGRGEGERPTTPNSPRRGIQDMRRDFPDRASLRVLRDQNRAELPQAGDLWRIKPCRAAQARNQHDWQGSRHAQLRPSKNLTILLV